MKNILFICTSTFLSFTVASASPFYRETFKLCSVYETSSKNAMDLAGWKAFRSDSTVGKVGFLKINTPGSFNLPLAYNSFPRGPEDGSAFWSKNVTGLTLFTDEFAFDVSSLALVQFDQRLSGFDKTKKLADGTQLAFLIGNTWYISDQLARQEDRGVWEPVAFTARQLTYGTSSNRNGRGPDRPGNFNVKLPQQGIVTAFGVFLPKVNGRVRIDNFTLSDLAVDARIPGEQGSLTQCSMSTPTTPSSGDINQKDNPVGKFCTGRAARSLGKISTSKSLRSKLLLSISGKDLRAQRDRAIFSLLLSNNLRIDNLVNVTVSDYFTVGSIQLLNASGVTTQTIPIKPSVKRLVDEFLKAAEYKTSGKLPLFQLIDKKLQASTGSAMCTNNLASLVQRQTRIIKATGRVRIKS